MNKTEKVEITIVVILIVFFCGTLIYSKVVQKNVDDNKIDTTVFALNDVNRFFSIDSSISKYVSYVSNKDVDNIIKVLDKNYKENNNISSSNVFDFVGNYNIGYISSTREIYQVSSNNNIYKYYAKVRLLEETFDSSTFIDNAYFEVTINENELTFAIAPISEIVYMNKIKEATNG